MALSMAVSTHTTGSLKPSCPFSLWASRSRSSSSSYGTTLHRLELERFHNDARDRSYTNHQSFKRRTTLLQYYDSRRKNLFSREANGRVMGSLDSYSVEKFPQRKIPGDLIQPVLLKSSRKNLFSREANGRVMGSLDSYSVEKFPQRQIPGDLIQPVLLKSSRENWVSSIRKKEDANVQTARPVITGLLTDTSHGKYEQAIPVRLEDTNDEFKHQKCESSRGLLIPNISNSVVTQLKSSAPEKLHILNGRGLEDLESSRVASCSTSSTPGLGITKRSTSGPNTSKQVRCMKRKGTAKLSPSNNGSSSGIEVAVQKREELLALFKEGSRVEGSHVNGLSLATLVVEKQNETLKSAVRNDLDEGSIDHLSDVEGQTESQKILRSNLCRIYDKVLVIDNIASAKRVVSLLTTKYRHLVHACDTEVSRIDVKQETPVDHGEITCFSIYSRESDFGNGKSCIWVDVLDGGGKDLLVEFAPFFEDSSIKKVWHNYSFDCHVVENYGIKLSGFHADTMHMARLWNSSRRLDGGYSLEALTSDPKIIPRDESSHENDVIGKVSMKSLFGRRKVKKDGSFGKLITIPPIEEIQREDRKSWICYSSLDSISTLRLYESMKCKLSAMPWSVDGKSKGSMVDFYNYYWRPFGELLTQMETEGMLVDRQYLAEVEKVAVSEQAAAAERFRSWASKYCPDARHMNVGSDTQLRQLFFGGIINSKNSDEFLPEEKQFKIPNVDNVIEEGKKAPLKNRNITLRRISDKVIETELYTASGWPSVSGVALKALAGKVSADYDFSEPCALESDDELEAIEVPSKDATKSVYGTAYAAFGKGRKGKEACHAIASLCEVCSIDSLISNFILPLQGNHISGKHGRIHCSLNINTETGRLSARRPNLQNQPALEKDRYKIRQAFIASPGNSLIVADYGQLELRILAHLAGCKSMMDAFEAGGDFHSRTAMNMYPYIRKAVEKKEVILEWHPQPGEEKPPVPLLKDAYGSERRKAKMLNFSIAYGKTPHGLAKDWKVSKREAEKTVELWYNERKEVLQWQEERRKEAAQFQRVRTLLGRCRHFPSVAKVSSKQRGHIERAAINTPVQGSAADVAMCAMLEIAKNARLKELGWKLLLQVHDEVILEGPTESAEEAKGIVVECMSKPFNGVNFLKVDLAVDAKCAQNWYSAK